MACDKINPTEVTLNGASSAYGGEISKVSLNFGTLAGGIRASVTLVGGSLSTPLSGDNFTLGVMGIDLNMKIASYSFSSSATSMSSLDISLVDKSNDSLDHEFIVLKEEVPDGIAGLHYLGTRYGPAPNTVAKDLGFIIPSSSTEWVDIREYMEELQIQYNALRNWANAPAMTDEDVNAHILASQGKTLYSGEELQEVLEDVLDEDSSIPEGQYQFDGSFRDVVMSVCNQNGSVPYWDAVEDKLVIADSIDWSVGNDLLDDISTGCTVVSASNGADFTTSLSVGAIGKFSSTSSPTQGQDGQGGKVTRYYKTKRLNPTFHYRQCAGKENHLGEVEEKDLIELDPEEEDLQKAFYASFNDRIYAMYVLQTVLYNKGQNQGEELVFDPDKITVPAKGEDNEKDETEITLDDKIRVTPCTLYTPNDIFIKHYCAEKNEDDCAGEIWPIAFEAFADKNSDILRQAMIARAKDWDSVKSADDVPQKIVGLYNPDEIGVFAITPFYNGYHVIKEKGYTLLDNIFNAQDGLMGEKDPFRLYLNAIFRFYNRFHVVRESSGLKSVTDRAGLDYGFYLTYDSQGPAVNMSSDAGFTHVPANPYLNMEDCAVTVLKDLFVACSFMYTSQCNIEVLRNTSTVDWVNVLDRNKIKEFFTDKKNDTGAGTFQFSRECYSKSEIEDTEEAMPVMHFYIKDASETPEPELGGSSANCFGKTNSPSQVERISKGIGSFNLADNELSQLHGLDKDWSSWVVVDEDMHAIMPQATVEGPARLSLRSWIDTAGTMGTLTQGPGPIYLAEAEMPAGGTWNSKLNRSISVDAADLSKDGSAQSDYLASSKTEGSEYLPAEVENMKSNLSKLVKAHAWTDDTEGANRSITVILGENFADFTLPTIEEGLEALTITNQNGKLEIGITVGNSFERAAKRAMFEMMTSTPTLQHVQTTNIPDTFVGGASPTLVQISKGIG